MSVSEHVDRSSEWRGRHTKTFAYVNGLRMIWGKNARSDPPDVPYSAWNIQERRSVIAQLFKDFKELIGVAALSWVRRACGINSFSVVALLTAASGMPV